MSSLQKREWLLLAKAEPLSGGHSLRAPPSTFYVIVPSRSPTLLVKAVATRELLLPSPFPLLPEDPPDVSFQTVEASGAQISWGRQEGERSWELEKRMRERSEPVRERTGERREEQFFPRSW